jgi:anti-sigma B factor antagonist
MSDWELRLEHAAQADAHTLFVGGELDLATARELVEAVAQLVAQGAASLTLDLGAVTFMDSTGMQGVFAVRDLCEAQRCELALTLGQGQVQRVFALAGVEDVLPFRDSSSGGEARESYASKRRRFAEGMTDQYLRNTASA